MKKSIKSVLISLLIIHGTGSAYKQADVDLLVKTKDCQNCDLSGARLLFFYLPWSHLEHADLSGANLTGSIIRLAYLHGAILKNADLTGVDLAGADLTDADLSGADLTLANLNASNLEGAIIKGAIINGIRGASIDTLKKMGAQCKPTDCTKYFPKDCSEDACALDLSSLKYAS